ncbi:ArsA family ATPase [Corynebacterium sp. Q4381]|uniref:ArsA family ATPase n=1 Tax=Corynebacterium sp. Marseille-Q4381 TaxID=3121597 RepID=UPI002FE648D2
MLLTTAPVMFFGGKGGVGKTTVSAATAVRLAEAGKRVLLVSTDPAHNLGHVWGSTLADAPVHLEPNLHGIELDPDKTTQRHLDTVAASMRHMMPERLHSEIDRHMELSRHSPGMHEAAMLERIAELVAELTDKRGYDHIIFDTAPSGHTSRLLELPEIMSAYTGGLLARREASDTFSRAVRGFGGKGVTDSSATERRNQQIRATLLARQRKFEGLRAVLTDAQKCVFNIVLTAERLPVMESAELYRDITASGIHVGGLVINRRTPAGGEAFLETRRGVEKQALELLDNLLPGVKRVELPWLPGEVGTREALGGVAKHL